MSSTIISSYPEQVASTSALPEILWNFSRYTGRTRISLEQNPHFYLRCPADESAFTPLSQCHPIQDTRGVLGHNDTLYVLFNGPSRVFLHTEHKSRMFCNVWLLNGFLIFRGWCHASLSCGLLSEVIPDGSGILEGEKLVRVSSSRYVLRYCERPVVHYDSDSDSGPRLNHTYLPPIVTTSLTNLSLDEAFEDWAALSRSSRSMDMHVYSLRVSPESIRSLVRFRSSKSPISHANICIGPTSTTSNIRVPS